MEGAALSTLKRGPMVFNGFLSGIDRYRSANQKAGKWGKRPVNRITVNECAQCGADLFAAEWSEHVTDCCVRNVWSCDACGYQFEDTVYLSAREGRTHHKPRAAPAAWREAAQCHRWPDVGFPMLEGAAC